MREAWKGWCDQVCREIRFVPDRKAVREELDGHMTDHFEALLAEGMEEEKAERRAVEVMGNPEEVGLQLNSVHKPLLGWLWLVSKVLAIAAIIAAVVLGYPKVKGAVQYKPWGVFDGTESDGDRLTVCDVPDAQTSGGYTFTFTRAALWSVDEHDGNEAFQRLYLELKVAYPPFGSQLGGDASRSFYMVDDKGNRYETYYWAKSDDFRSMNWGRIQQGFLFDRWVIYLGKVDVDAQWIELRCRGTGQDLALRVPLTGGDSA